MIPDLFLQLKGHWPVPAVRVTPWPVPAVKVTRDWKVAGLNPCMSGRKIFFPRVDFLCWLLFQYPFHPRVTAVARKRSWSFCQKCRWQVTAKKRMHLTYVALHEVTWCTVVWSTQNLRRDGCSFIWHHMRPQWVCSRERRIALYKRSSIYVSDHQSKSHTGLFLRFKWPLTLQLKWHPDLFLH